MNKYLSLFVSIVICFLSTQGTSQIAFNSLYDFNNRPNYGLRAIEIESGFFISAGASGSNGGETFRYLHIDTVGNVINKKEYEILNRYVREGNLIKSYDNNFIDIRTVGYTLQSGDVLSWLTIQKVKRNGDTLWRKEFNFTQIGLNLSAGAMSEQADSGLFIACQGYRTSGDEELVFISTDKNGNERWRKVIDTPGKTYVANVIKHPNEGYLIGGGDEELGQFEPSIMHVNDTGKILWKKHYSSGYEYSAYITLAGNNSIIISTDYFQKAGSKYDITKPLLIKTDLSGNVIWSKVHVEHTTEYNAYSKTIVGYDGMLYSLGYTIDKNSAFGTLSQSDSSGTIHAIHNYKMDPGIATEYLWDFIQTSDSGFLFVGDRNAGNGQDVWVLKTKKNGCIDEDCSTLIYGAFLGADEVKNNTEHNFKVFPNPAVNDQYINLLGLTIGGNFSYEIISSKNYVVRRGEATTNRITIDGLCKGLYYIRVVQNDKTFGQSFIIQ